MKEALKQNAAAVKFEKQTQLKAKQRGMYVIKNQRELQRLDMVNLIGEMAVNIGHQVRNPMTTVRGYLQMFSRKQDFAHYKEQFITMIEEIDRANVVITEFLSLAKNKRVDLTVGNLNTAIEKLLPLIQANVIQTGQEIYFDHRDLPEIPYDEKEISQLVLNLVKNSQEATSSGGIISIKTSVVRGRVELAVQDNGHGIPKEILDRLGTPFITTRDNGIGIGMAVCYRIAEHHNAAIHIKTSKDGTTVSIRFPK